MTTFPLVLNSSFGGTISSLTIQCSAGNGTGTITIQDVAVTGLTSFAISTTEATYLATGLNSFVPGQDIKIVFPTDNGLTNVSPSLAIIRSIPSQPTTTITTSSGVVLDGTKEEYFDLPLVSGSNLFVVPFAIPKTDFSGIPTATYRYELSPVENITDATVLDLYPTVVSKTSTSMTLRYSGNPDSANYYQRGHIKVI